MTTPARRDEPTGVGRSLAEGLAAATADLYRNLEALIIGWIARRLAAPVPAGQDWATTKGAAIGQLRAYAESLIAQLDNGLEAHVEQAVILAWKRGGRAALAEMARQFGADDPDREADRIRSALPGADAITRLVFAAITTLRGTHTPILRWALDSYRTVIAADAPGVLAGTHTRVRAAQVAWERLLGKGITGFTDKAGRNWELASYVEMAMRTTTAQAAVEGHMDRLAERGVDLVYVSDSPRECPRCRPWEHKILNRKGGPGPRTVEVEHATRDGEMIPVKIAGSVTEAVEAGLLHPNCTHSLSAYLPGLTKLLPTTQTANPQGYKDRQRLRYLERQVRAWKRRELGATDDLTRKRARRHINAFQGKIRAHVDATGLHRLPRREQIGTAR